MTVLPCFSYILIGKELFATFSQSIRNMLQCECGPSSVEDEALAVTTVWQLLMNNDNINHGPFNFQLVNNNRMCKNMHTLQCKEQQPTKAVRLERILFIHDVWHGFSRVQCFLARRAVLRKIKDHCFTKLVAFIRIITGSSNTY